MQRAIRARALQTIEIHQNQPRLSLHRKLMFAALSALTVIGLMILINYGVAIMQHIFELWMKEDAAVPTEFRSDQPFYITVDPARSSDSSESSAAKVAR